jgi:RNA polymerase sigma-70 factor (ECF subfamily)
MLHLNPAHESDDATCCAPPGGGLSSAVFEHFVREYHERLLGISVRMLRSAEDAADVLQDALLSAWLARHSFQGQSTVYTWLYRIVKNSCLMKIRSLSAGKRVFERRAVPLDTSSQVNHISRGASDDSVELAERDHLLRLKIEQLPPTFRQILLLREIEQLSTAETAARLSVSPSVVKTRLCRARAELRQLLAGRCVVS